MGFFQRLANGLKNTKKSFSEKLKYVFTGNEIDEDFFEELEMILVSADIGAITTEEILEELKTKIKQNKFKKTVKAVPENLPVYFVAGADDPVGDYGKGVLKAKDKFVKAGVKDVSITLYENSRHEILNDNCKERVYEDVLKFINGRIGKRDD